MFYHALYSVSKHANNGGKLLRNYKNMRPELRGFEQLQLLGEEVSVIIPTFNCSDMIDRAFKSVLNQTVIPGEIIFVDDASTDSTVDVIEELLMRPRPFDCHLIRVGRNSGPGNARNLGWEAAKCRYIAFLDGDDTWHKQKLQIQLEHLHRDPDIALIGGPASYRKETNAEYGIGPVKSKTITKWAILLSYQIMTPTVIIKKEVPFRFDSESYYAEDRSLWLRIVLNNYKAVRLDRPTAFLHKPQFGHSGLSGDLWNFEKANQKNYDCLYKDTLINKSQLIFLKTYSFLKYIRRVLTAAFRSGSYAG